MLIRRGKGDWWDDPRLFTFKEVKGKVGIDDMHVVLKSKLLIRLPFV